jgi:mannosyltransferase
VSRSSGGVTDQATRDRAGLTARALSPVRQAAGPESIADRPRLPVTISPEVWVLIAITAVGGAIRFATLTGQSYWFDEATTAHEMQLSFGAMWHALRVNESTPPLYYVLAWIWAKAFGTGEAGLRSLSALAGTALIPVTYLCGRELVSRWAGYVAAGLAAVSPFLIWYSQEARAYMLFALLCGLSLLFFARTRQEPTTGNIAWWGTCSALAMLTHFFAGFLIAPEALWLLVKFRSRAVVVATATLAVVQAAMVPIAVGDLSHPLLGWIKQFPLHVRVEQVPVDFALSTLHQSSIVTKGLLAAGVAALIAAGLSLSGSRGQRRGTTVAAVMAGVVLITPLLLAEVGRDYYIARNLIPAWIPLAVVIGAACTARRTLPIGIPLAVVCLGGLIYALVYIDRHPQYQRPDWRGAAHALGTTTGRRAIVAFDGEVAAQPMTLYLPRTQWAAPPETPATVGEVDVVGSSFQTAASPLPAGTRLIASSTVHGILVDRFDVSPAWHLTPAAIAARAGSLVGPAPASAAVVIQAQPRP